MIDVMQFRDHIVFPALTSVGLHSEAAEQQVIGTAITESKLTHLKQIGGGPALGLYQMEPATERDIWENYIEYKKDIKAIMKISFGATRPNPKRLIYDLYYSTVMCRLHYFRVKYALPQINDLAGQAQYWKDHYNTSKGKGTVSKYMRDWREVFK